MRTPSSQSAAAGPNKKRRLQQLLAEPSLQLGHSWQASTSKAVNSFAVSCTRCQLYIEQCNAPDLFTRKINHPCRDIPAALPGSWSVHASHSMVNKGAFFTCTKCLAVAKIGAQTTSKTLQAQCCGLARKKGGSVTLLKTKAHEQVSAKQSTLERGSASSHCSPAPKAKPKPRTKACPKAKPKNEGKILKQGKLSFEKS